MNQKQRYIETVATLDGMSPQWKDGRTDPNGPNGKTDQKTVRNLKQHGVVVALWVKIV